MSFDTQELKLHPHVYKLREEFAINVKKAADKFNHWFCLKEEKRLEFIKTNNIYPQVLYPPEPRGYEEESNLLRKLRQMEIEGEINIQNMQNQQNIMNKSKNNEKDRENELMIIENMGDMKFEPKSARKTGKPVNFSQINQYDIKIDKNIKVPPQTQRKNESVLSLNQFIEKNNKLVENHEKASKRKKELEKFNYSPNLKKKLKK